MTLQQLQAFCAVAKHLNFTKAASELHMAQPTLSRQLRMLEEEWGFFLFVRDHKEVRLTPSGAIMLTRTKEMLALLEDGIEEQRRLKDGVTGILRIGVLEAMEIDIPAKISKFAHQYPGVALQMKYRSFGELRRELEEGSLDVIFTLDFEIQNLSFSIYNRIRTVKCGLILSREHPLAAKQDLKIEELRDETFILPDAKDSPGRIADMKSLLLPYGIDCARVLFVPNRESIHLNVCAGNGVGIVSTDIRDVQDSRLFRFLPLEGAHADVHVLCVWKRENFNPAVALFTNAMIDAAEEVGI